MKNSIKIDAIDLRLLALLQADASMTNQSLAEKLWISPPTCLRRTQRLRDAGVIEKQVAILEPQVLAVATGQPQALTALVEVSLNQQAVEWLNAFEERAVAMPEVQQCWRVSPGPDFLLVLLARDMAHYQRLAEYLFTQDANVRNVKAFFATRRAKFGTQLLLPQPQSGGGEQRG